MIFCAHKAQGIATRAIDFLVLDGNESAAQSIKQAAERLAELAKLKASPLLEVNASEGWAEAISSNSEYEEDLEAYELDPAITTASILPITKFIIILIVFSPFMG